MSSEFRPSYEAWCSALEDHTAGLHANWEKYSTEYSAETEGAHYDNRRNPLPPIPYMGRCDARTLVGPVATIFLCGIPLPPVDIREDVTIAVAAKSSVNEEEKDGDVDINDVKNDVKYNSSTIDYLPTYFEYYYCVTLYSTPNSSVVCCIDGELFFDSISSSFISDDVKVSENTTSISHQRLVHQLGIKPGAQQGQQRTSDFGVGSNTYKTSCKRCNSPKLVVLHHYVNRCFVPQPL